MDLVERIHHAVHDLLKQDGYTIVRIKYSGMRSKTLQIMIERLDDVPITVDDCVAVNNIISVLLDTESLISESYTLEISSAGIDRPLTKLEDYHRFKGQCISVKLGVLVQNRKKFIGTIYSIDAERITLNLKEPITDGLDCVDIEYQTIQSAHLHSDS